MIRLILRDIKDTWITLLYLCLQISVIFILFIIYSNQVAIYQSEQNRIDTLSEVEFTEFTNVIFNSVGDIHVDSQNIVFKEEEYLSRILEEKKAYTSFDTYIPNVEYPVIVVVGDAKSVLEQDEGKFPSIDGSGVYLGNNVPKGIIEVGEEMNVSQLFKPLATPENEENLRFKVLGRLEQNFDLPNLFLGENLDDYILMFLTLEDYRSIFANYLDTEFLTSMVVKDFSEQEVIEYINKFSLYPYRILREKEDQRDDIYLKESIKISREITFFAIATFSISMFVLYVMLKRVFIKKYQELVVAKAYGSGWFGIYFRMLFLIAAVFIVSLLLAYTTILKYLELHRFYYVLYLLGLFIFSVIYTAILLKGVKINDGKK